MANLYFIKKSSAALHANFIWNKTEWIDVRNFYQTNNNYREMPSRIWENNSGEYFNIKRKKMNITQGFLVLMRHLLPQPLGREGLWITPSQYLLTA
jgi:hypothetical protein